MSDLSANLASINVPDRMATARLFVGKRVRIIRRDASGDHGYVGQVVSVASMLSLTTRAVLVLSTERGDVAMSLAIIVSIEVI